MSPRIRVGDVPLVEERVGAAVHPDEHRPDVADVGAERGQVLAVAVPADHDEDGAAREVVPELGQARPAEEEVSLLSRYSRVFRAKLSKRCPSASWALSISRRTEAWLWRIPTATS